MIFMAASTEKTTRKKYSSFSCGNGAVTPHTAAGRGLHLPLPVLPPLRVRLSLSLGHGGSPRVLARSLQGPAPGVTRPSSGGRTTRGPSRLGSVSPRDVCPRHLGRAGLGTPGRPGCPSEVHVISIPKTRPQGRPRRVGAVAVHLTLSRALCLMWPQASGRLSSLLCRTEVAITACVLCARVHHRWRPRRAVTPRPVGGALLSAPSRLVLSGLWAGPRLGACPAPSSWCSP